MPEPWRCHQCRKRMLDLELVVGHAVIKCPHCGTFNEKHGIDAVGLIKGVAQGLREIDLTQPAVSV